MVIQKKSIKMKTPFLPRSPYAVAKLYAYWITINYREAYNIFACNGILFNHESPIRGETFVTKKIVKSAVKISKGLQDCLYLGNLNASRDWGHARDYVEGMWMILQQKKPEDFVFATGKTYTVRYFVEKAFSQLDIKILWKGKNLRECGIDQKSGKVIVKIDPKYFRPTEVDFLKGDASKAKKKLGWRPKTSFRNLVKEMIEHELKLLN